MGGKGDGKMRETGEKYQELNTCNVKRLSFFDCKKNALARSKIDRARMGKGDKMGGYRRNEQSIYIRQKVSKTLQILQNNVNLTRVKGCKQKYLGKRETTNKQR